MSFHIHISGHVTSLFESLWLFLFAFRIRSKILKGVYWALQDLVSAASDLILYPSSPLCSCSVAILASSLKDPSSLLALGYGTFSLPAVLFSLYQLHFCFSLNSQRKYHFPFPGKLFLIPEPGGFPFVMPYF